MHAYHSLYFAERATVCILDPGIVHVGILPEYMCSTMASVMKTVPVKSVH
jgi:hypothetical protein